MSTKNLVAEDYVQLRVCVKKDYSTYASITAQKMKFSIKGFFSKCDQICSFLWIWSPLLKKFLMENFIFCAVHLTHCKNKNETMHYIHESETDILRVAKGLINSQIIKDNKNHHSRKISSKYVKMSRKKLNERYNNKKMHVYFRKQLERDNNIDMEKSNSRSIIKI